MVGFVVVVGPTIVSGVVCVPVDTQPNLLTECAHARAIVADSGRERHAREEKRIGSSPMLSYRLHSG
jgi:hypothetical protein